MKLLCLFVIGFLSCQTVRLDRSCHLSMDEIKSNWDVTAPSKWNYSCFEFLKQIQSNQNCFIGMDTSKVFKIFGQKHSSDLYQDGKWRIHFPVALHDMSTLEYYLTLDFIINSGKIEMVYCTEVSKGATQN